MARALSSGMDTTMTEAGQMPPTAMSEDAQMPPTADEDAIASRVENSTDATRGEPLATRAQKRKLELQAALDQLGADHSRERQDIVLAVSSIDSLLSGDTDHLSHATSVALSRLLEGAKHLAESAVAISSAPAEVA
jgi:hypothetical protein